MKINSWSVVALLLMGSMNTYAQETKPLSLEQAMQLAYENSNQSRLFNAKTKSSELAYISSKDNQLPEAKLTGTYMFMNSPSVDLKIPVGEGGGGMEMSSNHLMLGQLSVNMPLYTGGKIKNSIALAKDNWKATELQNMANKENLAVEAMHDYIALYKVKKTTELIAENIKKAEQQVHDFKAMEANGVIARNDLLKAELQLSNYKVSYQEAVKNTKVLNQKLAMLLGLNENTEFKDIQLNHLQNALTSPSNVEDRHEIQSLNMQKQVAQDNLKIAKADYYPTIAATAGYAALNLQNVATITNAANVGVGVSYNISSLYKNNKKVNQAKQHIEETKFAIDDLTDKIKTQIYASEQDVILAKEKQKLYQEAFDQAKENYRIVKDKYDNGVADTDDLLEADVQQLQSQINLAVGEATIVEKYYELKSASGQLNLK